MAIRVVRSMCRLAICFAALPVSAQDIQCGALYADFNSAGSDYVTLEGAGAASIADDFNDQASSLWVASSCNCTYYSDFDYGGDSITVEGPAEISELGDGWNDRISSYTCEPVTTWLCGTMYADADFQGEAFVFYKNSSYGRMPGNFNDALSSLRIGAHCSCDFYEHEHSEGESITIDSTSQIAYIGDDWNDRVSSFSCVGTKALPTEH